jgi:hypothetical protein
MKQQHCCRMAGFSWSLLPKYRKESPLPSLFLRLTGVQDALRDPLVFNAISTCTDINSASA